MEQQTVFGNSLVIVNSSLYSVITSLKQKLLGKIQEFSNIRIKGPSLKREIVVTTNFRGNESIEVDFSNMELNKFYLITYNQENYLYRKTSKNILESYEVF